MSRPRYGNFTYSYPQLERLWIDAGGPSDQARTAAAIAEAESGGNPLAAYPGTTVQPGQGSWTDATGLWQILGSPGGSWTAAQLTDPLDNAKMAVEKFKQGGWSFSPWQTWTSGAYRKYEKNVPPAQSYPPPPYGSGGSGPGPQVPYKNPFRSVQGLSPGRIDAGVDYSGTGPVYALGPGVITNLFNAGWGPPAGSAPGAFIGEKLTAGPLKGRYVYVAEGIQPSVRVGQHVTADTVIGHMGSGGGGHGMPMSPSSIETGFAAPPGTGNPLGQFTGSAPTQAGMAYNRLLTDLHAPGGSASGKPTGSVPSWMETIWDFTPFGFGQDVGQKAGGIAGAISDVGSSIGKFVKDVENVIEWFTLDGGFVRVICGIFGTAFVFMGLVNMGRTGRAYSMNVPGVGQVPTPSGGELAPAIGIAEVTFGAILLFFAFHNLQAMNINSFQDLLSYVKDRVHGQQVTAS